MSTCATSSHGTTSRRRARGWISTTGRPFPSWYQVHLGGKDVLVDGVRILPFRVLCSELAIP